MASLKKQKKSLLLTLVVAALFLLSLYLLTSGFKLDLGSSAKDRRERPRVTLPAVVLETPSARHFATNRPRPTPVSPHIDYGPPGLNN